MKNVLRFVVGIFFTLFFLILILLATIRFELLNKSFLFGSLEKHNVYSQLPNLLAASLPNDPNLSKEERTAYADFAKNIPPQVIKPLIEDNLSQIIDFLNGDSKNIVVSFSLNGVGFQNASSIRWSLSELPDKNLQERIQSINGIGNTLIAACIIIFVILIILFFLYGQLTDPKQIFAGRIHLLSTGIYMIVIAIANEILLMVVGKELMNGKEPSQKIAGLLSSSLFSDIITTWLIIGGVLILLWLIMKITTHTKNINSQIKKADFNSGADGGCN